MISIYEPLYIAGQELAEPAFLPLRLPDNSRAEWREFRILVEMHRQGRHRGHALTGLLSPKFRAKTGLTGDAFIGFMEANGGADVYMINPYPQMPYMIFNVWTQAASAHPGIMAPAQALLDASGIGWKLDETPRQGPDTMCFSNFWVGTEAFWDEYVGGILVPIAEYLEAEPDGEVARAVMGRTRYGPFPPAPFLPFIIERLFSTYLSRARPAVHAYHLDPIASCPHEFERDIVRFLLPRVSQADRDGDFPRELKQWMFLLHRLRKRFSAAYYAVHPNPETGEVSSPANIEDALRRLAAEAAPEPLR